jgi:hypothetical protein
MKKVLIFAIIITAIGCTKEPVDPPTTTPQSCEVFNTGIIKVVNKQVDPYDIYLNNVYKGSVQANSTLDITTTPNTYSFLAEQKSGYLFYPTKFTASVTSRQCRTQEVNF